MSNTNTMFPFSIIMQPYSSRYTPPPVWYLRDLCSDHHLSWTHAHPYGLTNRARIGLLPQLVSQLQDRQGNSSWRSKGKKIHGRGTELSDAGSCGAGWSASDLECWVHDFRHTVWVADYSCRYLGLARGCSDGSGTLALFVST